jgi:hypothetical protein
MRPKIQTPNSNVQGKFNGQNLPGAAAGRTPGLGISLEFDA